jgi:DNA-binding NarL/FixJ family response regulator
MSNSSTPPPAGGNSRVRVLLVDDHTVVRQGIAAMLRREPDIEIVGEATDGDDAVDRALELVPDVILMDYGMPRMDGIEATRAIHSAQPQIRIIGLSMYEEADCSAAMLSAGASAYVSKSGKLELLLAAIRGEPRE